MWRALFVVTLILGGTLSAAAQAPNTISTVAGGAEKLALAPETIRLPLFFEANQGQSDSRVKYLTRSGGYTLFLTPTETVLAEAKTQIADRGGFGSRRPELKSTAGSVVRMQLVGANPAPAMQGLEELPGKVNYLIGTDPSQWHSGVSLFSRVRTSQIYPGVDLLFHGDEKRLEYDFIVAPGADPSKIKFRIRGATRLEIDSRGDLVLHTSGSEFRMYKPVIYQTIASERRPVEGSFVKQGKREVLFRIGSYDRTQALVIDPMLSYSTFLGGDGEEQAYGIAVDDTAPASPKLYIGGFTTDSTTFPEPSTTIGFNTSTTAPVVAADGFVAKIAPTTTGSASLIYLTFVGGKTPAINTQTNCLSLFVWLALDESQGPSSVQPVLGGETTCSDFPATTVLKPVTGTTGTGDSAVATRLTVDGSGIDQSALLGGNNDVNGGFIAVDGAGNILLSGDTQANNLPVSNAYISTFNNSRTPAPYDDCFVSRLNRSDLSVNYLTYLNVGAGSTSGGGVGCGALEDSSGNILAGGNTYSTTAFNLGAGGASLANGFQTSFQGTEDTFAMKLNPSLSGVSQLLYATYYGGGGKTIAGNGSLNLGNGVVAIVGGTTSGFGANANIPTTNAFQSSNLSKTGTNGETGFLVLVNTSTTGAGSLQCSTYFGGSSGNDFVHGVADDAADPTSFRILLGGETGSTDFPTLNPLQPFEGTLDGFVSVLKVPQPGQSFNASLYFSTFIGSGVATTTGNAISDNERIEGLAVDSNHTIYGVGNALSSNFFANTTPATVVNGFQTTCTSCALTPALDDLVLFSIGTGAGATLQSIVVSPASPTIPQGGTQQFTASGYFNDGTIQDITTTATWVSTNLSVATIGNTTGTQGLATASSTNSGTTAITASQSGITSPQDTLTVATSVTISVDLLNNGTSGTGTIVDNSVPRQINCTSTLTGVQSGACGPASYPAGAMVTFTETPGAGSVFTGWSNYACQTGTGGTTATCTIIASSSGSLFGNFANGTGTFTLTTALPTNTSASTGGGRVGVGVTGGGITCTFNGTAVPTGTCSVPTEKSGEIVELIPVANDNSTFAGWTGTCPFEPSGSNDCYVTMSQNRTVTPVFTATNVSLILVAPSSLTFSAQVVNTTSASQTVTVSVPANSPSSVNFSSVTASSGFTESDNCADNRVAPGNSCTIQVSFAPTTTGTISGSLSITDNATGSPQSVTLRGTSVSGNFTALPLSLNFGSVTINTTSLAKTVTVSNGTASTVSINAITPPAGFEQTSNCMSASLIPNGSCTINVTFRPTTTTTYSGNLVIQAASSSLSSTVALTGSGSNVPFMLTIVPPAGGSSTTPLPVSPGGQVVVGLLLTPIPGFSGTVTFSCASSAPQFLTCASVPTQVKLSPAQTQVAIVVNTFCQGAMPTNDPIDGPGPGGLGAAAELLLAAMALGATVWASRRRSLSFAVLLLIVFGSAACKSLPKGPDGPTPPGLYTLHITATTNGQSVTVQQAILVQ
jgi:Abnormal spindle-like microcephaly-assoc'd, ASPM-SPD-2-Hydin/Bacterial Ig-like domain (group 2)